MSSAFPRRVFAIAISDGGESDAEFLVGPFGPGYGFGLDYSVLLDPGKAIEPLSPGTFAWGGAFGTWFFVDPVEDMIGIVMVQLQDHRHLDHRLNIGQLATQAIVDPDPSAPPRIRGALRPLEP